MPKSPPQPAPELLRVKQQILQVFTVLEEAEQNCKNARAARSQHGLAELGKQEAIYHFRLSGDIGSVRYESEDGQFTAIKGMTYIAKLLASPNKYLSAMQLEGVQAQSGKQLMGVQAQGGMGDQILDDTARAEYRDRLRDIDEAIEEAQSSGDRAEQERLQEEKERILDQLRAATGLGGRSKPLGTSPQERSRQAVSQALRRAYKKMDEAKPPMTALVKHLKDSITAHGTSYSYRPKPPAPQWEL